MNIAKEISNLLYYNECVIVPGFGGFISNYIPAEYNPEEHTFSPPSKEVFFNSKINRNDGLLINHLAETTGIGYHQANRALANFVDKLYKSLNNGETIELENLGSFSFDRSGNTIFKAVQQFQLTEAYGLNTFTWAPEGIFAANKQYNTRPAIRAISNRTDVLKIAASIVLLLGLSLFPLKNQSPEIQSSSLNPIAIITQPAPVLQKQAVEAVNEAAKEKAPYILVGGSFSHLENANTLKAQFAQQGFNPEIIDMEGDIYRVIVDSYASKNGALQAMEAYRASYPKSGVWVSTR